MAFLYAMSDIHAQLDVFKEMLELVDLEDADNKLILLGDYIGRVNHVSHILEPLYFVKNLQEKYPGQVEVLVGNHEEMLLEDIKNRTVQIEDKDLLEWVKTLRNYYYETDTQIFVHAGVREEAEDDWKWGTEDWYFCGKYPQTTGTFYKDIIAGHIGTSSITGNKDYHKVFWDGESHYFIDGSTEFSKCIPLLKYDTETKRYSSFEKTACGENAGKWVEYPIV